MMGNVNQITPDGTLSYDQTGTYTYDDPYTGESYDIPTFTATQTLSPEQQAIQGQLNGAKGNLATVANNQSSFLKDYLGQSVDMSGIPGLMVNAGQKTDIGGSYSDRIGNDFRTSIDLTDTYAGADDFSADRQRVEDALWERGASKRASESESLRTRLLNSGLREGSAAWNAEMERQGRQVSDERIGTMLASGQEQSRLVGLARDAAAFGNDARLAESTFGNGALATRMQLENGAALQRAQFENDAQFRQAQFSNAARSQGMQEAYAARNQPIQEIIGLMSGSQIQQPNFVNANMPTIPTTDNAGIINTNYDQRMQQWRANQGVLGGGMGGIGSLIGLSDDDAKKDKQKIGTAKGMGLYEFRYKGESSATPKHVGLMASEVEKKKPAAVKRGKDGLRYVDYGKALGLMEAR